MVRRQLSSSLSDAVLCATATCCAVTMYHDTPRQPLASALSHRAADDEQYGASTHSGADFDTGTLFPSILASALPESLQLTSLSSLVVYGYFFLALASAAGTLRFTGELPSVFVRLHTALTHVATLLTIPSFALALFPLAHPTLTRTAASTLLAQPSQAAATPSLPLASFFSLSLSCLLLFPQLFRHLPRPIALGTSAAVVSAAATVVLLYAAVLLSRVSAAGWWLVGGALPLLMSSAMMGVAPSCSAELCGGVVRLHAVDVFHYAFSATCLVWLYAFRMLLSTQLPVT